MSKKNLEIHDILIKTYSLLYKMYGPMRWWPADGDFEVCVGAILTQNTNWLNVEKAINNLKSQGPIKPSMLKSINARRLARLIRPCGYYNIKTKRLKNFISYLYKACSGNLRMLARKSLPKLRGELLDVKGIGPETADSMLLYAFNKPVFVVDAYTRRIAGCLGIAVSDASYDHIQRLFMDNLPKNRRLFNEYHALIVEHAKKVCKSRPNCKECVLHKQC